MAIKLKENDHQNLDKFFETILTWHAEGEVELGAAVAALAHVFTAAAIDNDGEVESWLNNPETLRHWKDELDADRTY